MQGYGLFFCGGIAGASAKLCIQQVALSLFA